MLKTSQYLWRGLVDLLHDFETIENVINKNANYRHVIYCGKLIDLITASLAIAVVTFRKYPANTKTANNEEGPL